VFHQHWAIWPDRKSTNYPYVPNRVIVKFKSGGDANAIAQFKAQLKTNLGVSKIKRWNKIDAEVWQFTEAMLKT
jgi:hypothetical protein